MLALIFVNIILSTCICIFPHSKSMVKQLEIHLSSKVDVAGYVYITTTSTDLRVMVVTDSLFKATNN